MSSKRLITFTAMVFVGSVAFVGSARADTVIYDNLGAASSGEDPANSFGPLYESFSTPTSTGNLLDMQLLLDGSPSSGTTTVSLLSDSLTSPGTLLTTIGTLNDGSLLGVPTVFDFALAAPYALSPGTRYWVEVSDTGTATRWSWSFDLSGPGVANEYYDNAAGVTPNNPSGAYQMQVTTPEAATASLLLLGFGLVGIFRRKYLGK